MCGIARSASFFVYPGVSEKNSSPNQRVRHATTPSFLLSNLLYLKTESDCDKNVKVKERIDVNGNSISQLRSVTRRMGSHSVTCHPTQVNVPRLHPSQTGWYSIYRPFKGGGLSKPRPRVQRATGPLLLRDSPQPARPEPMT